VGHDDHTRTVALIHVAFGGGIEEVAGGLLLHFDSPPRPFTKAEDWQQAMCCDKLARRANEPDHDDSWLDEAGYVECRLFAEEGLNFQYDGPGGLLEMSDDGELAVAVFEVFGYSDGNDVALTRITVSG